MPVLLWTIGHDLVFHAAAGQLEARFAPLPGMHLMDRPTTKENRRRALNAILRALRGETVPFYTDAHGERWLNVAAPIRYEGEVKGALGQTVHASHAGAVLRTEQAFLVTRNEGDCRVGDLITLRLEGAEPIQRHTALPQEQFDHLLTARALTPVEAAESAPIPEMLCGAPTSRLALVR